MIKIGDYLIQHCYFEDNSFNTYVIKVINKYGAEYECQVWFNGESIGHVMEWEEKLLMCRKMTNIEIMLLTE
jgi:hypothetical protein